MSGNNRFDKNDGWEGFGTPRPGNTPMNNFHGMYARPQVALPPKKNTGKIVLASAVLAAVLVAAVFLVLGGRDGPQDSGYATVGQASPPAVLTGADVFELNVDAVFTIYVSTGYGYSPVGSGFFITPTGVGVTNHHVMVGWPSAAVYTHNGERFRITGFYNYDINNDLAIIQVDAAGRAFQYVTMSSLDGLRVGEDVFAIGSPRGIYRNTFTSGVLSRMAYEAVEFDIYRIYNVLQFTAPITGGNSGGPLFDSRGEVIGVNTAGYRGDIAQNINFAVRIDRVSIPAAGAALMQLPIGDVLTPWDGFFVGTWIWYGGYYVFYADGTGRRDWDAGPGDFYWRLIDYVLEITQPGYERETWAVRIVDDFAVYIGGAIFDRIGEVGYVPDAYGDLAIADALVGTWSWFGGIYIFYDDHTGWRDWEDAPGYFTWRISHGFLITYADDTVGRWTVEILGPNEAKIADLSFVRR